MWATKAGSPPNLSSNREALEILSEAIGNAGYQLGDDIALAMDVAASELYQGGKYVLAGEGREFSSEEMTTFLEGLLDDFPLVSIEDGLAEDDWDGWKEHTRRMGNRTQLVGDDIFVTNESILRKGIKEEIGNAILIKVNQIGSLSETLHTMETAERAGYGRMVSHRSGETEDAFIAHLVVATNAGQIKTGAPAESGADRQVQPVAPNRRVSGRSGPLRRLGSDRAPLMISATGKTRVVWVITLLLLVAVALVFSNVFPFRQILAQQELVEQKEQTLAVLQEENARLTAAAEYLQTDQGVEKIARQDFGYVRPGEVAYVVVAPPEEQVEFVPAPPEPIEELDRSWWQGIWDFLTGRDLLG